MYNHLLDSFMMVAKTGSFTKAGDALHLSSTGVMKQINLLEEDLGVTLFNRSSKGVSLTNAGMYLFAESHNLKDLSVTIRTQIRLLPDEMKHVIRIGISPINPMDDFIKIWHASPRADQFCVTLVSIPTDINAALPEALKDADYSDIGFCSETSVDQFVSTEAFFFTKYRVTLAVPISHPLAKKKQLSAEDLRGETLVLPSRGMPEFADRFSKALKNQFPDITVKKTPQFYDLQLFNRCSDEGRLLLSLECWDHLHPEMVNLPVDWNWELPYGLIYKKDARKDVLDFIEAFKEAMAPDQK
ncbi:MAG: LysR family transcriptional regulator [Lachnospiraceae bacterium]|nr:LysR family transcriptional regulator [Lachnospiraceae bacterium]